MLAKGDKANGEMIEDETRTEGLQEVEKQKHQNWRLERSTAIDVVG